MTSRTSMDANAPREVAYAAAASRVSGHDVSALVLTPPPPPPDFPPPLASKSGSLATVTRRR